MRGPWWLPPGSIRDLLAVMVVASLCYGFISGRIPSDQFIGIAAMVLSAYGLMRQADKGENGTGHPDAPPPPPTPPPERGKG